MEASYIVKRGGERAPVRFDAITDRNEALCSAAYGRPLEFVRPLLTTVTQEVVRRFKNGMSAHDLDMLTAAVCAAQSTRHQDFGDLAARIIVSDLQKRTESSFAATVRRLDAAASAEGLSISRLHPEFVGIAERAADEVDRRVDFARDFRFTCFGIQTMIRSYLLREAGQDTATVERPQHTYMRVALALCVGRPDRRGHEAPEDLFRERLEQAFEVYDLLSTQRLTHASPTMFNAGTNHSQLSSCYLLGVDDNLNVLLQVDKDAGMISQRAGGIGVCLTPMRAEGALIKTTGGKSSGLRRYGVKLNSSQLYVNQAGLRPGAYALYLETWHADIFTFIELGRFKGVAVNAPDLKYALWVNDLFMEAVVEELRVQGARARGEPVDAEAAAAAGDWHLFSPDRAPGLDRVYGDEFRELYRRYVAEGRHERVVKASAVVTEWFKTVAQKGNPYILFKDHINRKSNLSHYRTITNSNLCVAGETLLLTDGGYVPISDLAGRQARVWNGREWSEVGVRRTADEAELVRVTTDDGLYLVCTPAHKFYLADGAEVRAGDPALPGACLERGAPPTPPVVGGGRVSAELRQELAVGGRLAAAGRSTSGGSVLTMYDVGGRLALDPPESGEGWPVEVKIEAEEEPLPPLRGHPDSVLSWLAGFYAGGGAAPGGRICCGQLVFDSFDPRFQRRALLALRRAGVAARPHAHHRTVLTAKGVPIQARRPEGVAIALAEVLELGPRGLVLPREARLAVEDLLLEEEDRREDLGEEGEEAARREDEERRNRPPRVVSVEGLKRRAPTYCFTEPLRGRGVFGGILTGQCAEITIPCFHEEGKEDEAEYGTCNLGAIPLASFVVPDARAGNPGRVRVDWKALIAAAGVAVRNLDNVIDINFYPVEACRRSNMKHRPVALGVMGLADVLAKFRYAYGSPEARALDRALHAAVYYGAMAASSRLGEERGNFASFEGSAAQRGLLQPDLWVECGHLDADGSSWEAGVAETTGGALAPEDWAGLRARCGQFLRNAYVTADMPTATSSQATGQNECFEPFTSNLYTRKTLAGEFTLLNPHLLAELEAEGLWDEEMRRALIASAGSVQAIARVPVDLRLRYRTARELDQRLLTLHAKARNPFLSQSQSLNYYFGEPRLRDALGVLVKGWQEGLTTGSYYMHTQPAAGSAKTSVAPPAYDGGGAAPAGVVCTEDICTSCSV